MRFSLLALSVSFLLSACGGDVALLAKAEQQLKASEGKSVYLSNAYVVSFEGSDQVCGRVGVSKLVFGGKSGLVIANTPEAEVAIEQYWPVCEQHESVAAIDRGIGYAQQIAENIASSRVKPSDFHFDHHTKPYKNQIIAYVQRLQNEYPGCNDIDPATVAKASGQGSQAAPVFFVSCGHRKDVFNVFFSKADLVSNTLPAPKAHYSASKVAGICRDYAINNASHPSTVDFSMLLDLATKPISDGRTLVQSSFTAKNSFGLSLKYAIQCTIDHSGVVIDAIISESR